MSIPGIHVKQTRLVQTEQFIVALEVDAIIPDEDHSEPCFEPPAVEFLKEVERHAKLGDKEWLMRHGRVYQRVNAA